MTVNLESTLGLYVRAYHTRHDLLMDAIKVIVEMNQADHHWNYRVATAITETFPNGKLNRHDPVQLMAYYIVSLLNLDIELMGVDQAVERYNVALNEALDTLEYTTQDISQKAVNTFLERAKPFDETLPTNLTRDGIDKPLALMINEYTNDSLLHYELG